MKPHQLASQNTANNSDSGYIVPPEDGIALISAAHPRPKSFWSRVYWRIRAMRGISRKSVEAIWPSRPFHLGFLAMHDPALRAYVAGRKRALSAELRALQLVLLTARFRALSLRLKRLPLKALILMLKTPDYLMALLLILRLRPPQLPISGTIWSIGPPDYELHWRGTQSGADQDHHLPIYEWSPPASEERDIPITEYENSALDIARNPPEPDLTMWQKINQWFSK